MDQPCPTPPPPTPRGPGAPLSEVPCHNKSSLRPGDMVS